MQNKENNNINKGQWEGETGKEYWVSHHFRVDRGILNKIEEKYRLFFNYPDIEDKEEREFYQSIGVGANCAHREKLKADKHHDEQIRAANRIKPS